MNNSVSRNSVSVDFGDGSPPVIFPMEDVEGGKAATATVAAAPLAPGERASGGDGGERVGLDPPYYQGGQKTNNRPGGVENADSIALHWLTFTGPETCLPRAWQLCRQAFGNKERSASGGGFYRGSWRWVSGCALFVEHQPSRHWMVQIPGGCCDSMSGPDLWALGRDLFMGATCTRVDIRRDLRGESISLIDDAIQSAARGELCLVKSYKPMPERCAKTGSLLGYGVYLGKRISRRFARIYDKGLESRQALLGQHVRFESELGDPHSHLAAHRIFGAESYERGMAEAARILTGVVDFREVNGRSELKRRPRPAWWKAFVGSIDAVRPRVQAEPSNAAAVAAWFQRQVCPKLVAIAEAAGLKVGEVAEYFAAGVRPGEAAQHDASTFELATMIVASNRRENPP